MRRHKLILLVLSVVYLSVSVHAQRFEKTTLRYYAKGYNIVMSEGRVDTQLVVDPVTSDIILKTRTQRDILPDSVNSKKVYASGEVTTLPRFIGKASIEEYLLSKIINGIEKERLPDGTLHVNAGRAVIDEKGKIAYYEYDGGRWEAKEGATLDVNISDRFGTAIIFALNNAPPMKPATLNGENVCAYIHLSKCDYHFDIKDHVVTYKKD